ncbi:MAG: hypothetical protein KTR20_13500 [Cellvibrionaceae bacterium]|nr:hypothetical protein [Cellvibrionaceae bacterium]
MLKTVLIKIDFFKEFFENKLKIDKSVKSWAASARKKGTWHHAKLHVRDEYNTFLKRGYASFKLWLEMIKPQH